MKSWLSTVQSRSRAQKGAVGCFAGAAFGEVYVEGGGVIAKGGFVGG
jgi:hypothetical protein